MTWEDGSWTLLVAQIACETGIAPNELLATPPAIWDAMVQYLRRKYGGDDGGNRRPRH